MTTLVSNDGLPRARGAGVAVRAAAAGGEDDEKTELEEGDGTHADPHRKREAIVIHR